MTKKDMRTKEKIRETYVGRATACDATLARLRQRGRGFVAGEIATFVAAMGFVVLYTLVEWGVWPLVMAAICLVLYVAIRQIDVKNDRAIYHEEALREVNLREVAYLDGDFGRLDDGSQYADAHHPFTVDLDVFGPQSLFHRINRTVTMGGSQCLARQLASVDDHSQRASSVEELAAADLWRADFMAIGHDGALDTDALQRALHELQGLKVAGFLASAFTLWACRASIAVLIVTSMLAIGGFVPAIVPIFWGTMQLFAVLFLASGALKAINKVVEGLLKPLRGFILLIHLIEKMPHETPETRARHMLIEGASPLIKELEAILRGIDHHSTMMGPLFMDALYCGGLLLVRRFLQWQKYVAPLMEGWITTVSEVDMLVSMATFCHNEPQATWAEVVDADGVVYEARGLWHPFLGEKAVHNDFTLASEHYYIVTGANMAGKSTFLRALGVNYILAMNGMPVFADSLRVSRFRLFSSMRTTDDLAHGISYFNAELLRLKQLMEFCKQPSAEASPQPKHTLVILDEILKGTNSLDKLNGSRLFLEAVAQLPVTGVIATHDLELSKMASTYPEKFHNYCFEIQLGTNVTYSYKVTEGVARNQNATFLLGELLRQI